MLSQSGIEQALYDWIRSSTGIPLVYWLNQNVPQSRAYPFATLSMGAENAPFPDERLESFDSTRQPGQEFAITSITQGTLIVSVQIWTAEVAGDSSARALLRKARTALGRDSIRAALYALGLAVSDTGSITPIPQLFATEQVGRASLDVTFNVADSVTEHIGYIETINGALTLKRYPGDAGTVIPFTADAGD